MSYRVTLIKIFPISTLHYVTVLNLLCETCFPPYSPIMKPQLELQLEMMTVQVKYTRHEGDEETT